MILKKNVFDEINRYKPLIGFKLSIDEGCIFRKDEKKVHYAYGFRMVSYASKHIISHMFCWVSFKEIEQPLLKILSKHQLLGSSAKWKNRGTVSIEVSKPIKSYVERSEKVEFEFIESEKFPFEIINEEDIRTFALIFQEFKEKYAKKLFSKYKDVRELPILFPIGELLSESRQLQTVEDLKRLILTHVFYKDRVNAYLDILKQKINNTCDDDITSKRIINCIEEINELYQNTI